MVFKIAFRNILRHRTRSLVSIFVITVGCVATIFVGGYFSDTYFKMRESYIHGLTGHLQIYKSGFSTEGRKNQLGYLLMDSDAIVAQFKTIPGVERVMRRLQFPGILSNGETSMPVVVHGVEPEFEFTALVGADPYKRRNLKTKGLWIDEGRGLSNDEPNGAILGRGLAKGMRAKVDQSMTLMATTKEGSLNAWDVAVNGVFYSSSKAYDDHYLRIPMPLAQELLRTQGVQSITLILDKTENSEEVHARVLEIAKSQGFDIEVKTWQELNDYYMQTKQLFDRMYLILKLVIALIIVLSIYSTVMMSVHERVQEIGTLRANGHRRSRVANLFVIEGLLLGLFGAIIGISLGVPLTAMTAKIGILMPPPPGTTFEWIAEPRIVFGALISAFGIAILACGVSSLLPAIKASKIEIANALRQVN